MLITFSPISAISPCVLNSPANAASWYKEENKWIRVPVYGHHHRQIICNTIHSNNIFLPVENTCIVKLL